MIAPVRDLVFAVLKLPKEPPEPPQGDHGHVEVRHASPAFLTYQLVGLFLASGFSLLPILVVSLGLLATEKPGGVLAVTALLAVSVPSLLVSYLVRRFDYELRTYIITDRSLRVREGALQVRELTLSYQNVQNVTLEQGPLERLFGFSNVVVDTAGGGGLAAQGAQHSLGHRAVLRGLEDAEAVRDLIRARLQAVHKHAGLGDVDETAHAPEALDARALVEVRDAARALADTLARRAPTPSGS